MFFFLFILFFCCSLFMQLSSGYNNNTFLILLKWTKHVPCIHYWQKNQKNRKKNYFPFCFSFHEKRKNGKFTSYFPFVHDNLLLQPRKFNQSILMYLSVLWEIMAYYNNEGKNQVFICFLFHTKRKKVDWSCGGVWSIVLHFR